MLPSVLISSLFSSLSKLGKQCRATSSNVLGFALISERQPFCVQIKFIIILCKV